MKKINLFIFTLLLFSISPESSGSQAIGFYSRGKLIDGENILNRPAPIQKLFLDRKKHFATTQLLDVIQTSSINLQNIFPDIEKLQIGDLSGYKGGKATRHASHQNGLDADIVYFRNNRYVQPGNNPEWDEEFVIKGKVSSNFHLKRNWKLIEELYENGDINRIFVDQKIKNIFCNFHKINQTLEQNQEILRHLRPLKHHSTHLHVRLKCPASNKKCKNQQPPPLGNGCRI